MRDATYKIQGKGDKKHVDLFYLKENRNPINKRQSKRHNI